MREVDDQIHLYIPVLRRIVVLVAVIIAVPVVLWTITAFVRTYVAPPKVPTFRSLTEQALTDAAQSMAAAQPGSARSLAAPAPSQPKPPETTAAIVEARATANDASPDTPRGPFVGDRSRTDTDAPTAPAVAPTAPAVTPAVPSKSAVIAPPAWSAPTPDPAPHNDTAVAAQTPSVWPSSPAEEELPAAEPISGPVPLPRRRPRLFAMAPAMSMAQTATIPVPRDRPASAPDATPTVPETPFGALRDYNR